MKKRIDLLNGPIITTLIKLSLPLMGISLIQMTYNLTDMFWIGKLGAGAVASVGTGGLFIWLSTGLHTIAQLGGQVYVAQNLGANKPIEAGKFAHASMFLSIIVSLLIGFVYFFLANPLVGFFNLNDPTVVQDAVIYLMTAGGFIIFMLFSKLLTALITTTGDSKTPFIATVIGLAFNILFDPLFIFGFGFIPAMGVFGAALATVLAQVIVFLVLFQHVLRDEHLFNQVHLKQLPDMQACKQIVQLGFPTTIQYTLFPLISMYISRLTANFGDHAVAVQRIGSQIESISWMTSEGFAIAVNSFVAQNYGANNLTRAKKGIKQAFIILGIWGIIATAFLMIFATPLMSLFFIESEVIIMGKDYLVILSLCQFLMCFEILSSSTLNAFGKTFFPALISTVFTALRIPLAIVLCTSVLQLNGIWWAMTISTNIKGLILAIGLYIFIKKIIKTN